MDKVYFIQTTLQRVINTFTLTNLSTAAIPARHCTNVTIWDLLYDFTMGVLRSNRTKVLTLLYIPTLTSARVARKCGCY
jgi:hypothetical protein